MGVATASAVPVPRITGPSRAARRGRVAAGRATDETGRHGREETASTRAAAVAVPQTAAVRPAAGLLAGNGPAEVVADAAVLAPSPQVVAIGVALEVHTDAPKKGDS